MADYTYGGIDPRYIAQIKGFEGFTPRAKWDYAQHSNGYGTRARYDGETIDQAEAERRLHEEISRAAGIVDQYAPNLDPGTRAALTSLTYNSGNKWTRSGLGEAIRSGDMDAARQRFLEYVKAGGTALPGLQRRRKAEVGWFGQGGEQVASAAPAQGGSGATFPAPYALGGPRAPVEPVSRSTLPPVGQTSNPAPAPSYGPFREPSKAPAWNPQELWDKQLREGHAEGGAVDPVRDELAEYRQPELSSYDEPWYRALPNKVADWWYGPDANARQAEGVRTLLGPQNPLNLPGQVSEGTDMVKDGIRTGDYQRAALGGLEALGAVAGPFAATTRAVSRMAPSARATAAEITQAEKMAAAGRDRPLVGDASNDAAFDRLRQTMAAGDEGSRQTLADTITSKGGAEDAASGFSDHLLRNHPLEWLAYKIGPNGRLPAAVAGSAVATDALWNAGTMPWNWNEPGTVQHNLRNPPQKDDMKYPGGFPRIEKTEDQMRAEYANAPPHRDGKGPINGLFSGPDPRQWLERQPYDEWADVKRRYGADAVEPPTSGQANYPRSAPPELRADGGVVEDELTEYRTDPSKHVLSDPLSSYRTIYRDGPAPVAPWDRSSGKVTGELRATPDRPSDWSVSSGIAETLSPIAQGYGAGQMTGEAYNALKAGDYLPAAGNAALAAMAMVPMAKGKVPVAAAEKPGIRAYHGSPHDFERFSMDHIGKGEGAQAYGHGLYFAENEGVAKSYRDTLSAARAPLPGAVDALPSDIRGVVVRYARQYDDPNKAASWAQNFEPRLRDVPKDELARMMAETTDAMRGRMYEVKINADPEQFLDWDKPLSQQSEAVREAVKRASDSLDTYDRYDNLALAAVRGEHPRDKNYIPTGEEVLRDFGSLREPSQALREAGIPGIRYLDQGSRSVSQQVQSARDGLDYWKKTGDPDKIAQAERVLQNAIKMDEKGSRNYVVFDDALIEIMRKYGLLPPVAAAAATGAGDDTGGSTYRQDYRNGGRVHTALKIAERKADGGGST